MYTIFIQHLQPDPEGPVFGRVIEPDDLMALQDNAHDHITRVVKDMLVSGAEAAQVAGFAATLTDGLGVSIAAGNVIDEDGVHYQLDAAVEKILGAADPALPRKDLIYATLSIDAEAELELRPHRRLRTQAELEAKLELYPPTQFNVATEKHTKATINVRAGVPNANPVAPALNAGEVPLWQVRVDAGETELAPGDLTDVRNLMKSLYQVIQDVAALQGTLTQSGIREWVEDIVGAFASSPDGSLTVVYNDAGNAFTIVLAAAYKALLDDATSAATANKLMKRDANADVQVRDIKPTRQVTFPDSSIHRAAFMREFFLTLVDLNTPIDFHGAATGVYETVKRVSRATVPNDTVVPVVVSVDVAPEIDLYLDPADFENVSFRLEVLALHTATQPPGNAANVEGSDVQLWNATDSAQLAAVSFNWGGPFGALRSSAFSISGSGYKRLVLRARHVNSNANALLCIWRVRLIMNQSF